MLLDPRGPGMCEKLKGHILKYLTVAHSHYRKRALSFHLSCLDIQTALYFYVAQNIVYGFTELIYRSKTAVWFNLLYNISIPLAKETAWPVCAKLFSRTELNHLIWTLSISYLFGPCLPELMQMNLEIILVSSWIDHRDDYWNKICMLDNEAGIFVRQRMQVTLSSL